MRKLRKLWDFILIFAEMWLAVIVSMIHIITITILATLALQRCS